MTIYIQQLMLQVAGVRDDFETALYRDRDPDAALALLDSGVELRHLPTGSGAAGLDAVGGFLRDVIAELPEDLELRRHSRTVDRWQVADETTVGFTHDRELPWLLPGVPPTHRHVEVFTMSVARIRKARLTSYRCLWDLTRLRVQLGADS